ncbi:hypothetical protein KP17_09050 [Pectobacterium parvum]|nr:hypothetical protein KP17_09050 [Pectobacterium parvum]KHS92695.1 hypothetical protein RC88_14965 [Pectobacterium parvum]
MRSYAKKANASDQQCHCKTVGSAVPVVNESHISFAQQKKTGQLNITRFAGKLTIADPLIGV